VANPRDPSASGRPALRQFEAEQFDDSIFEKAAQSGQDTRPVEDDDTEAEEPARQREGLPPGFRMRHDAHYVDELMSGGRSDRMLSLAASEADDPWRAQETAATSVAPAPKAYAEVGESLEAIGTCLRLFRDTARPAAERVALDLIESEVSRAAWLVQALSILDDDPPIANGSVDLDSVVKRIARLLAPGRYRADATLKIEASAPGLTARGDEPLLTLAVAAVVMALQAATERVDQAVVRVRVEEEVGGRVRVEATQEALRMPASWRARFLDAQWTDRPGGRRIAVTLAAAERIAQLHRGTLTLGGAEHGGCRLVLSLPRG
jgi:signal transduction histidine kinase